MRIINRTYILAFGFAILMLGSSCSNFLEEDNKSNFTQDNYFQTAEQAQSAINELYAQLRFVTDGAGTYGESPFMMLEFPTGLLNTEVAQAEYNRNLRTLDANAENNYFNVWWENSYGAIANANLAIARIPDIDMNDSAKQQLIGQAKFIRAFNYYNLVRIFGDVPLILEPVDANSEQLYPERTAQADVYASIVQDLKDAESSGLPFTDDTGKVSAGAVKSYLASVYLTMAGYPLQAGDEYYQMAADKAKEVIDNGGYALFDSYDELHDPQVQNTGEFIFQNNYLAGANITNALTQLTIPRALGISAFSDELGALVPTTQFINSHEDGDKRYEEKQFYFTQYPSYNDPNQIVQFPTAYIYKYFDENAVLRTAQSDLNWTFMRYAEVLLTYAEAGFHANGATPDVLAAINEVRNRANLPDYGANITQEDIWNERFRELSFENKYWFDMVRRRKVLNLQTGNWEDFVGHKFSYGPTLTDKYLLFGVPQREIDNNKKLTQNPGW